MTWRTWLNPLLGRPIRVEHWENANASGPAAAKAMLGQAVSYDHLPFFFSDQYDLGMEFTGLVDGADALVYRGDVPDGSSSCSGPPAAG